MQTWCILSFSWANRFHRDVFCTNSHQCDRPFQRTPTSPKMGFHGRQWTHPSSILFQCDSPFPHPSQVRKLRPFPSADLHLLSTWVQNIRKDLVLRNQNSIDLPKNKRSHPSPIGPLLRNKSDSHWTPFSAFSWCEPSNKMFRVIFSSAKTENKSTYLSASWV